MRNAKSRDARGGGGSLAGRRLPALCLILGLAACTRDRPLTIAPSGALTTHYLPDYEYESDSIQRFATTNHLVVFNPGAQAATLSIRVLYEDKPPATLTLEVPAMTSIETNQEKWPVAPNSRFGLVVTSDVPVVTQATIGWTNTFNDYRPAARGARGEGPRETALSYLGHRGTATHWMLADGIVLDSPDLFIKESEWAVILNPSTDPAQVSVSMGVGERRRVAQVLVPPERVRAVRMDSLVPPNQHYGAVIESSVPVVVNWRRAVYWRDTPGVMAFWSAPLVGLTEAARVVDDRTR